MPPRSGPPVRRTGKAMHAAAAFAAAALSASAQNSERAVRHTAPLPPQVALSEAPPLDLGYMYLYRRTTPSTPSTQP